MITVRHIKAARALLAWSQHDLARKSKVSISTIERLEAVDGELGGWPATATKIVQALERAGIEFANHGEPGVRLRRAKK
jgi:transcriptional regulator with XRE-family HTH domain